MDLYVQFGCGWDAPTNWLNYDASPTIRVEKIPIIGKLLSSTLKKNPAPFPKNVKYGNSVRGLPLKESSCDGVYCSHVLEHLALKDCRRALLNNEKRRGIPDGIARS
jgi:hypothetical protein